MNKLNHHLRQYRHNNDDGLIMGYEQEGTEAFVYCLEQEIAELKAMLNALRGRADIVVNTGGFIASLFGLETVLKSTPAQCLASVKADAKLELVDTLESIMGREFGDATGSFLKLYANKLREGKS